MKVLITFALLMCNLQNALVRFYVADGAIVPKKWMDLKYKYSGHMQSSMRNYIITKGKIGRDKCNLLNKTDVEVRMLLGNPDSTDHYKGQKRFFYTTSRARICPTKNWRRTVLILELTFDPKTNKVINQICKIL